MSKADRGFASMDPEKARRIQSLGGKRAHAKGTAHEWTPATAAAAGRKGGKAGVRNRAAADDRRDLRERSSIATHWPAIIRCQNPYCDENNTVAMIGELCPRCRQ